MPRRLSVPLLLATASAAGSTSRGFAAAAAEASAGSFPAHWGFSRVQVDHIAGTVYLEPLELDDSLPSLAVPEQKPGGAGNLAQLAGLPWWAKALAGGFAACDLVLAHRLLTQLLGAQLDGRQLGAAARSLRGQPVADAAAPAASPIPAGRRPAWGAEAVSVAALAVGAVGLLAAARARRSKRTQAGASLREPAITVVLPGLEDQQPLGTPVAKLQAESEEDCSPAIASPSVVASVTPPASAAILQDASIVRQISAEIEEKIKQQSARNQHRALDGTGLVQHRLAGWERWIQRQPQEDLLKLQVAAPKEAEFNTTEFHRMMTVEDGSPAEGPEREVSEDVVPTLSVDFYRIGTECPPEPPVNPRLQKEYELDGFATPHNPRMVAA